MKFEIEIDDSLVTTHRPVAIRKPKNGDIVRNVYTKQFCNYEDNNEGSQTAVIYEKIKTYREPVLLADYGKVCEFSNNDFAEIFRDSLYGFFGQAWRTRNSATGFLKARIEVTDEAA